MRFIVAASLFLVPSLLSLACSRKFKVCESCEGESQTTGGGGGAGGARGGDGDGADAGAENQGGDGNSPLTCSSDFVLCDGACIDPERDQDFCGASGDCQGKNAGISCEEGDRCDGEGGCILDCPEGMIDCDGNCTDPRSDEYYCGASGSCDTTSNWGDICEGEERCSGGACRTWGDDESVRSAVNLYAWDFELNAAGEGMLVWIEADKNRYRPFSMETDWASVALINDNNAASMPGTSSYLGIDEVGQVTLLRKSYVSSTMRILGKRYDAEEKVWSDFFRVDSDDAAIESEPDFVLEPDDTGALTWSQVQTEGEITQGAQMFAFVDATGTWTSPDEIDLNEGAFGVTSLARRNGRTAVAWTDRDGNRLRGAIHLDGEWTARKTLSEKVGVTVRKPVAQMDATGNVVVLWVEEEEGQAAIQARTYRAETATWSSAVPLIDQEGLEVSTLRWQLTPSGKGLVVYAGTVDDSNPIWGCATYADGDWDFSCEGPVPSDTEMTLPQLAASDDSVVHLVWGKNGSVSGGSIQSSTYSFFSDSWSEPTNVGSYDETLDRLELRSDNQGRAVAVWTYYESSTGTVRSSTFR